MSTNSEMFSLKDKVIVVTGGTGILGGDFVKAIAAQGGQVAILGQNQVKGEERAEAIRAAGGKAIFVQANVLKEEELLNARKQVLEAFGKIDGLVNAAGGNMPEGLLMPDKDVFEMNLEGMRKAMDLNLWGTIIPTQVFGPEIAKTGNGSIVNISSVSSPLAVTRVLGYSMGKAAVDCYTRWFALEMANRYGDKVRINSIMPGFFLTQQNHKLLLNEDGSLTERGNLIIKQTPFKRFGKPQELTGALVWLLSDASQFVTGMEIGVDGGFTINSGV
jgi:NAD(P)-dependent dehydrogenase (short-subunit alcohol dehydrogenase family)